MTRLVKSRKSVPGRNCLFFATSMKVQAGKSLVWRLRGFWLLAATQPWPAGSGEKVLVSLQTHPYKSEQSQLGSAHPQCID